ncbi:MAG: hypothetical protein HUU38_24795 [Anaerolineales bacterium]|nr:hypothetical protein [Anaerolineales bacterium]
MSNDDSMRDKDGYLYEKNQGQYDKKWDFWSQDYARDKAETERQRSDYSWNGTPLYRPHQDTPSSSKPSSSAEGFLYLIIALIVIAMMLFWVIILATPILAPILQITSESALKRGDLPTFRKLKTWADIAGIIAALVVIGIAGLIGIEAFQLFYDSISKTLNVPPHGLLPYIVLIPSIVFGLIVFALSSITGYSPTAIVFLRGKEVKVRATGKTTTAIAIRRLNWIIGLIAIGTLAITFGSVVLLILIVILFV